MLSLCGDRGAEEREGCVGGCGSQMTRTSGMYPVVPLCVVYVRIKILSKSSG